MSDVNLVLEIESILEELSVDNLEKIKSYALELSRIDYDDLDRRENDCIRIMGYNPTDTMEDHEWEHMLKRDKLSREREERKK